MAEAETCKSERTAILQEIAALNAEVARSIARRYRGRGEPVADLEQAACLGLMKAVNGYRTSHGANFMSYAVPTISGEVKKHFRDHCWTVRPTRRVQELAPRVAAATADLGQALGRAPTVVEIAQELGESRESIQQVLASRGCYSPLSLDAPRSSADPDAPSSLAAVLGRDEDGYRRAEAYAVLTAAVRDLPERDRRILWMRYFEDLTQQEIAAELGTTQMQVSRLLTRLTTRLRDQIAPADVSLA
jgi:RNA polymerase sigma-B factor